MNICWINSLLGWEFIIIIIIIVSIDKINVVQVHSASRTRYKVQSVTCVHTVLCQKVLEKR